jgi:hypothetical protein
MAFPEEGKEMVFTQTEKVNVFYNDHFIVFNGKEGVVEYLVDILMIPFREDLEGLFHALGGFQETVSCGILPDQEEELLHQVS